MYLFPGMYLDLFCFFVMGMARSLIFTNFWFAFSFISRREEEEVEVVGLLLLLSLLVSDREELDAAAAWSAVSAGGKHSSWF